MALSEAFKEQIEQGTCEPIYIAEIDLGHRIVFEVLDYTAGSTDTAILTYNATPYTLTEGTEFVATGSNEDTAIAIADAFLDALPSGVNVYPLGSRVYAIIDSSDTLSGSSSDSTAWTVSISTVAHKFVTGDAPFGDYDAVLKDVYPVGIEIDPIARGVANTGSRELVFVDHGAGCTVRNLLESYPDLRGKIVRLYLGFPGIIEADFKPDGAYVVQECLDENGGEVTFRLADLSARLDGQKVLVDVINRHPLEALEDVLVACGVPTALYNATSLDPTQYAEIGHWCVSRHKYGNGWGGIDGKQTFIDQEPRESMGKRGPHKGFRYRSGYYDREDFGTMVEPIDALELVNDLLQIMDGILAPDEDGVFTFSRYDPDGAVSVALTKDDYADFKQPEKWASLYNHVAVKGPHNLAGNSILHQSSDRFSQNRHTVAGGKPHERTLDISSDWLNAVAPMKGALASGSGAGSTFQIAHAQANGFSGLRATVAPVPAGSPPTFVQAKNTTCTSSRLVYLLIIHTTDGRREIVSCDAATMLTVPPSPKSGCWHTAEYTIAARGLYGTGTEDWDNTNGPTANPNFVAGVVKYGQILVADITQAVDISERKLARLSDGLPLVPFRLALRHLDLNLGDKFTIDAPEYFDLGVDGSSGAVWEILRMEPQPLGAGPGIAVRAALVSYTNLAPLSVQRPIPTVILRGDPITNTRSLQLDGVDDYINYGNVTTLDGVTSAIFAGWLRPLGALSNGDILARDDAGQEQFRLRVQGAEVSLEIGAGVATEVTKDSPITLNTWHHIVVFAQFTTGAIYIYVDGTQSTTTAGGTIPATMPTPAGTSNLQLGASGAADPAYVGARVDEWVIGGLSGGEYKAVDAAELWNGGRLVVPGDLPTMAAPDHWFRFENEIDDSLGGLFGVPYGVPFHSTDVPN